MTIKELMQQVDVSRVVDAFLLLDCNFSEEDYETSFIEKYKAIPKFRKVIEENIRLFAGCTPKSGTEPHTIFIMQVQDDEDYEKKWKKRFACFATCDKDVFPVTDEEFCIFDEEGKTKVSHYSFDDAPMQEMVNYVIAQASVDELGKEVCVAKILSELFFWGAYPEDREKAVDKLYERLMEPIDEKDLIPAKSLEEENRAYWEEVIQNMSEDEKTYHLAKERFEEETEEILHRYWRRIGMEIDRQYVDSIKSEYKRRQK